MRLVVLSSLGLNRADHSEVMAPPLENALGSMPAVTVVRPPPLRAPTFRAAAPAWLSAIRTVRHADTLFWLQMSSRPDWPVWGLTAARPTARRAAWATDPWLPSLSRIGRLAVAQRLSPLFVSPWQALDHLRRRFPIGRFEHIPYAANISIFRERGLERDVFAYWMGGTRAPGLHDALARYCQARDLTYEFGVRPPVEAGLLAARARYFVSIPPRLAGSHLGGHARTGGMYSLPFRYFEGLAAGARLLGVRPPTGEYESALPRAAMLEVDPTGRGLAEQLDRDVNDRRAWGAVREAQRHVHEKHSWERRAAQIYDVLVAGRPRAVPEPGFDSCWVSQVAKPAWEQGKSAAGADGCGY